MVKLAVSLDPSRSLYSSASTGPRSHHHYHPVASKMLKWSSRASSRSESWPPPGSPQAPSNPVRPERSRPHHSYYDLCGCLRTIFPRAALSLQKDHRYETVEARVWRQVKDEA